MPIRHAHPPWSPRLCETPLAGPCSRARSWALPVAASFRSLRGARKPLLPHRPTSRMARPGRHRLASALCRAAIPPVDTMTSCSRMTYEVPNKPVGRRSCDQTCDHGLRIERDRRKERLVKSIAYRFRLPPAGSSVNHVVSLLPELFTCLGQRHRYGHNDPLRLTYPHSLHGGRYRSAGCHVAVN